VNGTRGKIDGFYTTNGINALGYYEAPDLPYYYSLLPAYALCANYFCGVLADTFPNRLVLYSGTALFQNWATGGPHNVLNQSQAQFFSDCTDNTLPQVAFITEAAPAT
jgi:phospholipase C